jgi:hypothetical protein
MTDSQFLYQLMLRVNEARVNEPVVPLWALLARVTGLQKELESGADSDRLREEALEVASVALRLAVDSWKGGKMSG